MNLEKDVEKMLKNPGASYIPAGAASLSAVMMLPFKTPGLPPLAKVGLAGVFGMSSAATYYDSNNGPSIATAWGVVYMAMFATPAIQSRRLLPIIYTAGIAFNTFNYGLETIDSLL